MQECVYCHKELEAKARVCPHCGKAYPTGRAIYTFPSVIVAFVICCVICFAYLRQYAGTSDLLSVILAVPIVLLLFAGLVKLGEWCG